MNQVVHPEMRAQVISCLSSLSDIEYQQRVWVRREYPRENFYDDLWVNVGLLFDTSLVLEAPRDRVGDILVDDSEAVAMERLAGHLAPLIAKLGDADESDYLAQPAWQDVLAAARDAEKLLRDNLDSTTLWDQRPGKS